jgi:hypothetical protein
LRRFYAKAVNCCAEVVAILDSGPDGGNCLAAGSCRGFNGTCADVVHQFADVPILPDYPAGMADYSCNAFPMDDKPVDSFLVGLISLAIGLPVTLFLATCFGIANDSEAPESWLEWAGWRKLAFGLNAHRRWHYTGEAGPPVRHVRWFVRSVGAPPSETAANLVRSAVAAATCSDPPWVVEAREAAEEAAADGAGAAPRSSVGADDFPAWGMRPPAPQRSRADKLLHVAGGCTPCGGAGGEDWPRVSAGAARFERPSGSSASESSAAAEARELAGFKRAMTAAGLGGVYICWALFSWCVAGAAQQQPRVLRARVLRSNHSLSGSFSRMAC